MMPPARRHSWPCWIAAECQNRTDGDRAMFMFSSKKAPLLLKVRPHRMTQTYSGMMGLFSKQDLSRSPYSIALPYHHYTDRNNSIASRGTAMAYRHYTDRNNSTRHMRISYWASSTPVQLQTTCFFLRGGRPTHVLMCSTGAASNKQKLPTLRQIQFVVPAFLQSFEIAETKVAYQSE